MLYMELSDSPAAPKSLRGGRPVIDEPWVKANLARVRARVEVLRLMNWKQAWAQQYGQLNPADSSAIKVFGSEFYIVTSGRLIS